VWLFVATALAMLMARVRGQARLARSDPLTGLGNRRALDELFGRPRDEPVVLAIGDLDDFKRINDDHGHLAGGAGADPRDLTGRADAMLLERKAARKRADAPSVEAVALPGS
jgi:predicted signal transduction protein with EAL and GGDEF domain